MEYEYIVVAIASALAGIGTGLVGLSAATAMVPLMIVLSFYAPHLAESMERRYNRRKVTKEEPKGVLYVRRSWNAYYRRGNH